MAHACESGRRSLGESSAPDGGNQHPYAGAHFGDQKMSARMRGAAPQYSKTLRPVTTAAPTLFRAGSFPFESRVGRVRAAREFVAVIEGARLSHAHSTLEHQVSISNAPSAARGRTKVGGRAA